MEFLKNIVFFICVLILKASCHEDDHIYSHMDLNTNEILKQDTSKFNEIELLK